MYVDDSALTEEQRVMRDTCRAFVRDHLKPFIQSNWQREWLMTPGERIPRALLEGADAIGIRTLGVPEEFGGTALDPESEIQTFSIIGEEIARGDMGFAYKLVQSWKIAILLRNLAPRPIQDELRAALIKVVSSPDVEALFAEQGVVVVTTSPEEFRKITERQFARNAELVRTVGLKAE